MSKVNFRKTTISSIVLFCFSLMFVISAEAITLGSATDLLKKKKESGGEKIDFKDAKTGLMALFFESSDNYLIAQELLLIAYGKNTEAAQVKEAIEYAKDPGVSDAKKLKNL